MWGERSHGFSEARLASLHIVSFNERKQLDVLPTCTLKIEHQEIERGVGEGGLWQDQSNNYETPARKLERCDESPCQLGVCKTSGQLITNISHISAQGRQISNAPKLCIIYICTAKGVWGGRRWAGTGAFNLIFTPMSHRWIFRYFVFYALCVCVESQMVRERVWAVEY